MTKDDALKRCILHTIAGSTPLGLNIEGSDRDEMGVFIEDYSDACGLGPPPEHIEWTSDHPSGGEVVFYSLRKCIHLILKGNPNVMNMLFTPSQMQLGGDARGAHLQDLTPHLLSRQAGRAYLGHLDAHRKKWTGGSNRSHGRPRPDLVATFGWDTKFAMHAIRLAWQGIELLSTGRLTLPLPAHARELLLRVRLGKCSENEALQTLDEMEEDLKLAFESSILQPVPNYAKAQEFLLDTYWSTWSARRTDYDTAKVAQMFPNSTIGKEA